MAKAETCARCKAATPSYDFDHDSTFWGSIQHETTVTTTKRIRILNHYWRRNPKHGSEHLTADEKKSLCSDCSGLLIGRFLQGRDTPAVTGTDQ